jgi:hypothetical protein
MWHVFRQEKCARVQYENLKGNTYLEDQVVIGKTILKPHSTIYSTARVTSLNVKNKTGVIVTVNNKYDSTLLFCCCCCCCWWWW